MYTCMCTLPGAQGARIICTPETFIDFLHISFYSCPEQNGSKEKWGQNRRSWFFPRSLGCVCVEQRQQEAVTPSITFWDVITRKSDSWLHLVQTLVKTASHSAFGNFRRRRQSVLLEKIWNCGVFKMWLSLVISELPCTGTQSPRVNHWTLRCLHCSSQWKGQLRVWVKRKGCIRKKKSICRTYWPTVSKTERS